MNYIDKLLLEEELVEWIRMQGFEGKDILRDESGRYIISKSEDQKFYLPAKFQSLELVGKSY